MYLSYVYLQVVIWKMYRRNRFRRTRRTRRFKPRYKRKGSSLSKKVSYLMRQVKQNKPELKFFDNDAIEADIYSTPTIIKLGYDQFSTRLTLKSIQMKGFLKITIENFVHNYRIVIFTDKSNEGGATPAWSDVFKTDTVDSLRAIAQGKNEGQRFKILYDKRYQLVNDLDAGTWTKEKHISFYKKLNIPSITSTGNTWWEKGGLYLAFMGTSATTACDFTYNIRTRFTVHSDV